MNDSVWETLAQPRISARICVLFKAYTEERAWETIGDRLQDQATWAGMIMIIKLGSENKEQIGKYFFVNGTIKVWY